MHIQMPSFQKVTAHEGRLRFAGPEIGKYGWEEMGGDEKDREFPNATFSKKSLH
jgi:hypothetical protein